MRCINVSTIRDVLEKAGKAARKREILCFHKREERLQRMLNACLRDTYVAPHKHEKPDKLEIFCILKGRVAVLFYDNKGNVTGSVVLDEKGNNRIVEIPPRRWHNFVVLSKEAVLYEIIDGVYDPKTHKDFAPWAPGESDFEVSVKYLKSLKRILKGGVCNEH